MDEEICSAVLEEPPSGAVEERNTAEECEAPAPPRVAWGNNSSEKQSRWMSFRAGVLRVWNAGERLFQTNETQVCAFVPSQELPHTPSVEPTDPLESKPTDPLKSRPTDLHESRPTDPLESRPTDPLKSRPTDPHESKPTDPLKSSPTDLHESRPTDPLESKPTDLLESSPTDLHESRPTDPLESRPTDPLKSRPTDPHESKPTDPLKSSPTDLHESRPTDPLESRPTDPSRSSPGRQTRPVQVQAEGPAPPNFIRTDIYFKAIYGVGRKLKSRGDRSDYMGFRISDDKRVIIRCIKKRQPEKLVELPECPFPMSREAAAMFMLQKSPASTHINQLYGMHILKDQDVLVLEDPPHRMTLYEFYQQNRGSLTEHSVKHIVQQLVVALQHCLDHGVYHKTHMMNVLINPYTLQVKLTNFGATLFFEEIRADEHILYSAVREYAKWVPLDDTRILLDHLATRIGHWFWQRSRLSKECLDLLEKFNEKKSRITLENILHHDWFKNPSEEDVVLPRFPASLMDCHD